MLLLLFACTGPGPTVLLEADASRPGDLGEDGPYGASLWTRTYAARVVGRVRTDVVLPTGEDVPDHAPIVVFVQGGAVAAERYHWLAAHFASRGYATIVPHHPLDLAIFSTGNAQDALLGAWDDPEFADALGEAVAIGGHSLGGVVAVKGWLTEERFEAAFLLGSFPDPADDPTIRDGSPVLSVVGSNDQSALPADVEAGFKRFGDPRWYAEVDGLNHYGWTDDATAKELEGDGPTPDLETSRQHGLDVIDTFLDGALRGDDDALDRLDAGAFDGVEVHG